MRIAVTFDNGEIFQHFGNTETFKLYEVQDGKVLSSEILGATGSGHGALAGLLGEHAIDVLICGDIVVQAILVNELVSGMICYSGGGACGLAFIHLGPVGVNNNIEKHNDLAYYKDYFIIYGQRFTEKAKELFG